jgi:hypothetical protein
MQLMLRFHQDQKLLLPCHFTKIIGYWVIFLLSIYIFVSQALKTPDITIISRANDQERNIKNGTIAGKNAD